MAYQTTHTRGSLARLQARGDRYLVVSRRDGPGGRYGNLQAGQCVAHGPLFWPLRRAHCLYTFAIESIEHVRGTDER